VDRTISKRLSGLALLGALVASACGTGGASPSASRPPATSAPATSMAASSTPAASSAPASSAPASSAPASSAPASSAPASSAPASSAPASSAPASSAPSGSAPAGNLSGEIFVSGSSTVGPISAGVKELFNETNPNVAITVDEPGTGDGFALFCNGETDISDASRAIKDEEKDACAANGVEFVELKVAIDGLSIITSAQNTMVPDDCLTFADIYALIGPEASGVKNWNDAETVAKDLGSATDLPDAPLTITGPGEESGTFDSFVELVIAPFAEERTQDETTRPDYQSSGDDNVIIDGVAGTADNNTTLGWVGFAYAQNATDRVKLLNVDDGESEYPIARDLFIYVNRAKAEANPAVVGYVDFYLAEGTLDKVLQNPDARYVPLTDDAFAETVTAWQGR
jgi:phosphate transport system substrate-binding protein